MTVYRENLERLLDDKHFKDEIIHFNISEEGAVVLQSHRPQLIPMLMRCVFRCTMHINDVIALSSTVISSLNVNVMCLQLVVIYIFFQDTIWADVS